MSDFNTNDIGTLIEQLLRAYGYDEQLKRIKVKEYFKELVGEQIAKKITGIYIKDKVMVVKISSSVMRNELQYVKSELIKKINQFARDPEYIEEIILK
tara:strand:+ start:47891 stop:48184 length:294 start_codon:yes stop_codon:yes gene_type:complete